MVLNLNISVVLSVRFASEVEEDAVRHPESSSGLSFWKRRVSFSLQVLGRVQVGIEMNQVSPGVVRWALGPGKATPGMQCPLPARGPHRWPPGLLLGTISPGEGPVRPTRVVSQELCIAKPAESIPSHRDSGLLAVKRQAVWALQRGSKTVVFPEEGRRSRRATDNSGPPTGKKLGGRGLQNLMLRFFV